MNSINRIGKINRTRLTAAIIASVVLLGVIDYLTGPEISFSIFYLIPVSLASWFIGLRVGLSISLFCGLAWFIAEILWRVPYSRAFIPYWNALVRMGFFFIVAYLLDRSRVSFQSLEDKVKERTESLEKTNEELKVALSSIKTLKKMLPICSYCKKIRDDKGYWDEVSIYITRNTDTLFSHGICPDCAKKVCEELDKLNEAKSPSENQDK